jgi:sulfatase modifying factor 1
VETTAIKSFTETLPNGTSFDLIQVEGGSFMMGSEEEEALSAEKPRHEVKLGDFYIGKYPVTQALWKAVMGENNNPSYWKGDNRPVERVSWEDAQRFCKKLKSLTGKSYRLLTEAEWEYAARGGQLSEGYKYAGSNKLKEVGWYDENSYWETHQVGEKYPNELGIYDMSGNVWEWCQDWYDRSYYEQVKKQGVVINPKGPKTGRSRVVRGGSWSFSPRYCRCSARNYVDPQVSYHNIGFRLGLSFQ